MSGLGWRTRLPRFVCVPCALLFFLALITALYPSAAHAARKGVLWVRVIDTKTNKGIEGVEVSIKNTTHKGLTEITSNGGRTRSRRRGTSRRSSARARGTTATSWFS